jgi:hypothetical protein
MICFPRLDYGKHAMRTGGRQDADRPDPHSAARPALCVCARAGFAATLPTGDRSYMRNARTVTEIAEALEDVQVTLDVLVGHLGLQEQVQSEIRARRAKAERSRIEIERSLGYASGVDGESRR